MSPRTIVAAIALFLAMIVGGVVMMLGGAGGTQAYASMSGAELYGRLCAQCHGTRGTAPQGKANSYVGKRKYWDETSLLLYIENPVAVKRKTPHLRDSKKYMPALSKAVPMEARRKIVRHVLELMDALEAERVGAGN